MSKSSRKAIVLCIGLLSVAMSATFFVGGCYLTMWTFFIGGIVNVVDAIKAPETNSLLLATGIAKLVFLWVPIVIGILGMLFFGKFADECFKDI